VKTRMQCSSFLAALAIALGMISWGGTLHAQSTPSTPTDRQAQQTPQSPDAAPAQTPEKPPASPQKPAADQSQPPAQSPDASAPQPGAKGSSAAGAESGDSKEFTGTVVKQSDKYVLKDDAGKVYDIDHQDDVKKFEGKRVRVQGTLDPTGTKILVK